MLVVSSVQLSWDCLGSGQREDAGLWGRAGGAHLRLKSCHERGYILRSIVQK